MERRLAIVGAGISGLIFCKYALEKGFNPIVFEAEEGIGGVWSNNIIQSTKLQNSRHTFEFTDFQWPSSVKEDYPSHTQVLEYVEAYAQHYGLLPYIKFNSKVVDLDYVGESFEEMESWDLWGGTGKPFDSKGKWQFVVQDTKSNSTEVFQVEFVILCLGKFGGFPNIPKFPPNQGPEVFNGKVMHSMDYSKMGNVKGTEFIRGKRITIVGSQKTALDIAAECANANGVEYPCTVICRTAHWILPSSNLLGINFGFLFFSRLAGLTLHKPGETFLLSLLAFLLSPLRWAVTKFTETYIRWKLPLKKYCMIPNQSFLRDICSCAITLMTENFYGKVEEGSIIIKRSPSVGFCKEGLVIEGEAHPVKSDIVILATGYRGDKKITEIFKSPILQKQILGSPTSIVPLYRQIIHPRIPQLAVIGYGEGFSNLSSSEIRCQWLVQFLSGKFQLPSIRDMEKDVKMWDKSLKLYAPRYFRRSCVSILNTWYNDQLCKEMGCNPRRKKGILANLFVPYGPKDYAGLTH
ncbi:probable flavin-containing monooxygenase 1 [Ziziphus jujuba]|uniref:Flavin-containing monooxygenase n=1 Tax=Ziziphus jujuba TaxID=326968 RepID=A0A6P6FZN5_ZIZJJ|nr:probable flavin-containing monooxygenase 1 [Ziziphus jujuba]